MKKTDMLTMLRMIFNYLDDYHKDEFLRETENA